MSDGPIAIIQRWSSASSQKENNYFWLKAGGACLLVGLVCTHLFEYGELLWKDSTWMSFAFFVLYSIILALVISYLSQSSCQPSSRHIPIFSPSFPPGLTRLRTYFTFFPVTHLIHKHGESSSIGRKVQLGSTPHDVDDNGLSARVNAQMEMAIEAIVSEYVSPWYTKISDDRSFLEQCKAIIHAVFLQLGEKLRQVDRNDFAKEAIQIIHVHWKEYTDALNKNQQPANDEASSTFKFVRSFLQDNKEVSLRYQHLIGKVLEELDIPDLHSSIICQFVAGILVKNFIIFYVEMICQPSWINGTLMSLLSAGNMSVDITGNSSQNSSSPASPLPDPTGMPIHLFGDETMECASIGQSSTAESTPTKKSYSSSGRSASQEEFSAKSESHESKHFFDSVSSIEDASSSEPRTESSDSARPSPTERHLQYHHKTSNTSISTSNSTFPEAIARIKRPASLKPSSSMRTLSTALGSVIQATALPLLPSECYTEENSVVLPKYCKPTIARILKSQDVRDAINEPSSLVEDDEEAVSFPESELMQPHDEEKLLLDEDEMQDSTLSGNKSMNSSHYYSFDEASKPKSVSTSFFESSTLSLDGAIESRKQSSKDQLQLCSHEYKSESGEVKPNRSPVYEEPEDFAASIAKLRSLLEQKQGKPSTPPPLMDDGDVFEPSSPLPPTLTSSDRQLSDNLSNIPQISETCASETHTTPSSTSSMDHSKASSFSFNEPIINPEINSTIIDPPDRSNCEPVPEIKCCFRNVIIPKVENSADAGGQYIFYCIQYEGVYYDEKEEGQPQRIVYRTTTIKRKFKEFLTLQAHLEENAACKTHLKGIKTPTRWLNVSLTKSDATVAHQRRAMLEKYLQQLCYHPVIGFCQELIVFMAYGEDGFCSFEVGDPKDLLTHRLDKLAKKFTGVINSLKDALPSFELDLSPAPNTPKSEGITPCDLKSDSSFPSFQFQDKYSSLPHDKSLPMETPWGATFSPVWGPDNPESPKEGDNKNTEISTDSTFSEPGIDVGDSSVFSAYPLAAAVTQLLCDVLWLPQYRPHPASVATFMSISGKSLENYVVESMDIFLCEEAILGYLEWLTITINNGQSDTDSRCDVSSEFYSEQDLKNIVKRRIPAWVRWMWGRSRLELTIDRITGLFQNQVVNHDLILALCELLFSKIVNVDENTTE